MNNSARIDIILATLNAADFGPLDSIAAKFQQVAGELAAIGQTELAARATEAVQALQTGNVAEFQRLRAFLQSKTGHLR